MKRVERTDSQQMLMEKTERTDALGAGLPETYQTLVRAKELSQTKEPGRFKDFFSAMVPGIIKGEGRNLLNIYKRIEGNQPPSEAFELLRLHLQGWKKVEEILLLQAFAEQEGSEVSLPFDNTNNIPQVVKNGASKAFSDYLGEDAVKFNEAFPDDQERHVITENILRILMTLGEKEAKAFYSQIEQAISNHRIKDAEDRKAKLLQVVENKLPEVFPVFGSLVATAELRPGVQSGREDTSLAVTELQEAVQNARFLQTVAEQQERRAKEQQEAQRKRGEAAQRSSSELNNIPKPDLSHKSNKRNESLPRTPLKAIYERTPLKARSEPVQPKKADKASSSEVLDLDAETSLEELMLQSGDYRKQGDEYISTQKPALEPAVTSQPQAVPQSNKPQVQQAAPVASQPQLGIGADPLQTADQGQGNGQGAQTQTQTQTQTTAQAGVHVNRLNRMRTGLNNLRRHSSEDDGVKPRGNLGERIKNKLHIRSHSAPARLEITHEAGRQPGNPVAEQPAQEAAKGWRKKIAEKLHLNRSRGGIAG